MTTMEGFTIFCQHRCQDLSPETIQHQIPPSLKSFFRNFDDCVDLGGFPNPRSLVLRALAVQGVPTEDMPCIDVWDSERTVYSSHMDDLELQWEEEDGFYRVNKVLFGDFKIICRFGGPYADDTDDPTKVLFRYANHTGFLSEGLYELPKIKVDVMKRYADSFEDGDFFVSLMFDLVENSDIRQPDVLEGEEAILEGWKNISKAHVLQPSSDDVSRLRKKGFKTNVSILALQLTNNQFQLSIDQLVAGHLRPLSKIVWWEDWNEDPMMTPERNQLDERRNDDSMAKIQMQPMTFDNDSIDGDSFQIQESIEAVDFGTCLYENNSTVCTRIEENENTLPSLFPSIFHNTLTTPMSNDIMRLFENKHSITDNPIAAILNRDERSCQSKLSCIENGQRPSLEFSDKIRKQSPSNFFHKHILSTLHNAAETVGLTKRSDLAAVSYGAEESDKEVLDALMSIHHTGVSIDDLTSLRPTPSIFCDDKDEVYESDDETDDYESLLPMMDVQNDAEHSFDERLETVYASRGVYAQTEGDAPLSNSDKKCPPNEAESNDRENISKESISTIAAVFNNPKETAIMGESPIEAIEAETISKYLADSSNAVSGAAAAAASSNRTKRNRISLTAAEIESVISQRKAAQEEEKAAVESNNANTQKLTLTPEEINLIKNKRKEAQAEEKVAAELNRTQSKSLAVAELGSVMAQRKVSQGNEEVTENKPALKHDPDYEKYFKMLKVGLTMGAVKNALMKDGKDPDVMDGNHNEPAEVAVPLKEDPGYLKYFKMLKMGLPIGAVKNALVRDGENPDIMDLDHEKPLKLQKVPVKDIEDSEEEDDEEENEEEKKPTNDDPPLKDDPEYDKYFRMLKVGLPMGSVKNALIRDGKDPTIMDLDHKKSLKSQKKQDKEKKDDGPPLKEDPDYEKYFKMLKMGLPMGAVQNALVRDGKDPGIMDLDPEKSLKSQMKNDKEEEDKGPPLKEDPDYEKYFKMLKMGLPIGAVKNALVRDGNDPSIMDLDPEKSLKSQMKEGEEEEEEEEDKGPPLKEDPDYEKYFKMLKMGLPMGAVQNAIVRDGKDPSVMDLDPEKSLKSQMKDEEDEEDKGPPLKEDPDYEKYFKMLKMGLPMGAVQNSIVRDGKDPSVMDLDPEKSLKSQTKTDDEPAEVDNGIPLKDDPDYAKYFKMLKMGLPIGAVQNALIRDGKDPSIMDLDPEKSIKFQLNKGKETSKKKKKKTASKKKSAPKKPKVRRKKIYWTPMDESKIGSDSIWSLVRSFTMDKLKYDPNEFDNLFTDVMANTKDKKKESKGNGAKDGKAKQVVQLIDGKREMNGGIILARLKVDFKELADATNTMDSKQLDATQLRALQEFLPTDEEIVALKGHLSQFPVPEAKEKAISELSSCEKYMIAMLDVANSKAKFDCMSFKIQFRNRIDELLEQLDVMMKACTQVKESARLRKIMAMILTLGNQINTGGSGNLAHGFSLDTLLKLDEAKAFDKKTSVLQYLVKLAKENDETLLNFKEEIVTVEAAEGVVLDAVLSDIKKLGDELKHVKQTVEDEAEKTKPPQPDDVIEEHEASSDRYTVQEEPKFDGDTPETPKNERTAMEIFVKEAENEMEKAVTKVEKVQETYVAVLSYFREDANMATNDFFGTLRKFIVAFDASHEVVKRVEAAKAKELKREAKELKREAAQKEKESKKLAAKEKLAKSSAKDDQQDPNTEMSAESNPEKNNDSEPNVKVPEDHIVGKNGLPLGDIAAAALAKNKSHEINDKPAEAGGIAAATAAAASARTKEKNQNAGCITLGGIVPASAAARNARNDIHKAGKEQLGGEGIAAAAAAATKTKTNIKNTGGMPMGGIAAAAAAAAKARNDRPEKCKKPSGIGGLEAAEAALAVLKKKSQEIDCMSLEAQVAAAGDRAMNKLPKTNDKPSAEGGIAAAAAAAAAAKTKKKSQIIGRMPMGGIAAAAAAAAKARNEIPDANARQKETESNRSFFSGGIIPEVELFEISEENNRHPSEFTTRNGLGPTGLDPMVKEKSEENGGMSLGGINTAAAQARNKSAGPLAKQKTIESNHCSGEMISTESSKNCEENHPHPSQFKQNGLGATDIKSITGSYEAPFNDYGGKTNGGIAASAAAAALARLKNLPQAVN